LTLTRAELKKVLVVEKILEGHMTDKEGAEALGLSDRQVIRLKQKYQNGGGARALTHGNRVSYGAMIGGSRARITVLASRSESAAKESEERY